MKLIFCPTCHDVLKLQSRKRKCACGQAWGLYVNDLDARIGGKAIPLGISNPSFLEALESRPEEGMGAIFEAFVIPKRVPTIKDQGSGASCSFRSRKTQRLELIQQVLREIEPAGNRRRQKEKAQEDPGLSKGLHKLVELDAL